MLNTFSDIRNDVLVKLNHTTTMAFYTETMLNTWIQEAHTWAAGYKKWPFTEGRVETTFASLYTNSDGYLTGVYPEGYKPDSIRRLTLGGFQVQKTEFFSFLQFLQDNPNDTKRIYSNYGGLYYINPKIDVSGSVVAWGQFTPTPPDDGTNSLTIFSGYGEEGNEAIVQKVLSYAHDRLGSPASMVKGKIVSASIVAEQAAQSILDRLYKNLNDEQGEYLTAENDGMFSRFDVLNGRPNDGFHRDRWY